MFNTELVCKAVRLVFSCQTSAISFPLFLFPWVTLNYVSLPLILALMAIMIFDPIRYVWNLCNYTDTGQLTYPPVLPVCLHFRSACIRCHHRTLNILYILSWLCIRTKVASNKNKFTFVLWYLYLNFLTSNTCILQ